MCVCMETCVGVDVCAYVYVFKCFAFFLIIKKERIPDGSVVNLLDCGIVESDFKVR